MKKIRVLSESDIGSRYDRERKEKLDEELPAFVDVGDAGYENGMGWVLQGFIEDYDGKLRPQSKEELFFCTGCHAAIGSTIDQTFAFARKPDGAEGWGYIDLKGMKDAPSIGQKDGEILQYLTLTQGGDEFRENTEMLQRWFDASGKPKVDAIKKADVYTLITPSRERALSLNKAYTEIVRHQSYILGRDARLLPAVNVLKTVDESQAPLQPEKRLFNWDIRLAW